MKLLEAAASVEAPDKAEYLNDLAVAYLSRAEALDRPRDLTRALDAAILAAEAEPTLLEACFNRALALERLQLVGQAVAAWKYCLDRERDSEWRSEIRRHLSRLRWSKESEGTLHSDEGVLKNSPTADLQATRVHALERILLDWGEAFLSGRRAEADIAATRGRALGQILARLDKDSTVAEVFENIAQESNRPAAHTRLSALAKGARLYQEGRSAIAAYSVDTSQESFEQARALFAHAGSPLEAWAELGAIGGDFYRDDFDRVLDRLHALRPEIDEKRFPVLAGQWHWMKGMAHSRQGDLRAALRHFEATVTHFERTRERENLGAGYQLVGEMYRLLGDENEAWRFRMRGLILLGKIPMSRRRLMLLRDSSESLLAEGRSHAALAFQDEAVQIASRSGNSRDLAEMLLWRARARAQVGDFTGASADLQGARRNVANIEDSALQDRTEADAEFAEADLEALRNPEHAFPLFERPVAAYRRKGHVLPLATLLLHRARLARTLGIPDRELADLTDGIELFERQWRSLDADKDRVSFLETAQELYDAGIALEIDRGNPIAALELSERSRAFWTGSPDSVDAAWVNSLGVLPQRGSPCPAGRQKLLPANMVVVEYAVTGNRLLLWLLRCDGLRSVSLPITARRIEALVTRFRDAAQRESAASDRFRHLAEALYDILLRGVASDIPAGATLVFVTDKALHGMPFAALRDRASGRFLIEDHEIAFVPSVTFLKMASPWPVVPFERDVLLVSPLDPDLKESGAEIRDLSRLYRGARVLAGSAARRDTILEALDQYQVLHYAGHAEVNYSDPFGAWLPLASEDDSEAITARELQGLSFERLDLVVLSACRSVAATPTRTGGFLGLARPFLSGGAKAVVGTLWNIEDAASRAVLVTFHHHLQAGRSPAAALRAAQQQHLHRWPPSAWAAFAVIGASTSQEHLRRSP